MKWSSIAWTHDQAGFYYGRYAEPDAGQTFKGANYDYKLYYHRLGAPQSEDVLIYERPDQKEWAFGCEITMDGRYLIIQVWHGTHQENAIFYQDLQTPDQPVIELLNRWDASYQFIGNDGTRFYFKTESPFII